MTVERLLDEMSAAELAEWQAFNEIEPFGDDWRQTASVCAMVGNAAGGKRGKKPFHSDDFMPVRRHSRRQSGDEILAIFRAIADDPHPPRT